MTCIAGYVKGDRVWMGGDSAGVLGYDIRVMKNEKVFVRDAYVMGFMGSFRMGQLLQYKLAIPSCPDSVAPLVFMATDFIDAVRKCLGEGGFREKKDEVETGGVFLVGVSGALYRIDYDFHVGQIHDRFTAIGSGEAYAMGALAAMTHLKFHPRDRLRRALAIAEKFGAGVRRPFVVRHTP